VTELNAKRPVLDHGYVQYIDHLGDDLSPLEAARMSTGKETGVDVAKDDALRTRLWRDHHVSPFEMCDLVVEIQCPIFVLRQIDRHRTVDYDGTVIESQDENARQFMSRNEFSGRYATMPDLFFVPPVERIQKKGVANKQGSEGSLERDVQEKMQGLLKVGVRQARADYEEMIASGVSSEIARVALPLNQYTKLRLKGSLLSWLKFSNLRLRTDVQLECRVYAQEIAKILRRLWPKSWEVFEEHTLYAATFTRTEARQCAEALTTAVNALRGVVTAETIAEMERLGAKLRRGPLSGLVPDGD
jgi:thymidylate synthase (FAD)